MSNRIAAQTGCGSTRHFCKSGLGATESNRKISSAAHATKPPCLRLVARHGLWVILARMLSARHNQRARHSLWVALGVLCCALIVCASILQVGHIHPDGQAVQSDCALCHTAHLVIQPSIPQSVPPTVRVVAAISAELQPVHPRNYSVFSLFTRPPPVDIAFA